jgi:D-aspartate ligase
MTTTLAAPKEQSLAPDAVSHEHAPVGALVMGGDHPSLAIARSLARKGIPVVMIEDQHSIAVYSRYVSEVIRVKDIRDQDRTVESLLEIAKTREFKEWVLYPTRDEHVAAFSIHRDALARHFRVTTPGWDTIRWAWDKNSTYRMAEELELPCPKTWNLKNAEELSTLYSLLPLAIKPAVKERFFYATGAKAWRADTPEQLQKVFSEAARRIPLSEIMVQEIIPGDGQRQLSYCAFFKDGKAHSTLIARRIRQHPREFGRAATYVETADEPEIEELATRFLRAIDFYGLVEIEFKQDPRDGKYKLLDVNARAWGFHQLGEKAGIDFPYLLYADQLGIECEPRRAQAGIGWLRLITDVPVAISDIFHGWTTLGEYWRSLRRTRVESVFCARDPLPWVAEAILLPYLVVKKHMKR